MKYQKGQELICIRNKYSRKQIGVINFIKGKRYTIEVEPFTLDPDPDEPGFNPVNIVLVNEQGELQVLRGSKKTKYFKIPRPEGIPVTPPPPRKTRIQKLAEQKARKEAQRYKEIEKINQEIEWTKVKQVKLEKEQVEKGILKTKKFVAKDKSKRIIINKQARGYSAPRGGY